MTITIQKTDDEAITIQCKVVDFFEDKIVVMTNEGKRYSYGLHDVVTIEE